MTIILYGIGPTAQRQLDSLLLFINVAVLYTNNYVTEAVVLLHKQITKNMVFILVTKGSLKSLISSKLNEYYSTAD